MIDIETWKVALTVASILLAASSILQTLERSRRELASKLIYDWANHTDWATSRAIQVAKDLPKTTIETINAKKAAWIPGEHYPSVLSILRVCFPEETLPAEPGDNESFQITAEQSAFLKFQWVRWLNRLEGTLAAWHQGAADSKLMAIEFGPLLEGRSEELDALEQTRKGLPIIQEFWQKYKETGRFRTRRPLGIFPMRF